mgnify:CR=1 FL=1
MNKVFQLIIILFFIIKCSEPTPINYDEELTEINGIYYLKNTKKVYSGKFFTLFRDGGKKTKGLLKMVSSMEYIPSGMKVEKRKVR